MVRRSSRVLETRRSASGTHFPSVRVVKRVGKADSTMGASSGDQRPDVPPRRVPFLFPCTLSGLFSPNTPLLFGLQYSFHLSSQSSTSYLYPHNPPPISAAHTTHTIPYTQYTPSTLARPDTLTLTPYPTVLHSHPFASAPSRFVLCFSFSFSFLSFPFLCFFLSFCLYDAPCLSLDPVSLSPFLSALAFVARRLICAHSLSFTLPLLSHPLLFASAG